MEAETGKASLLPETGEMKLHWPTESLVCWVRCHKLCTGVAYLERQCWEDLREKHEDLSQSQRSLVQLEAFYCSIIISLA